MLGLKTGNVVHVQTRVVKLFLDEGSELFTAMKTHVEVFRVVTPCSGVVGYQRFGGGYCLHLQGEVWCSGL
jgi:hypothetical protein